ncbi:Spy/CpxP family protein refolding chaperone [Oscillatoria sp. FACHB-1406]|uniref:Spy/CpxP family protein refolding chaperone n=1 Tax=Oscillatoria sp. FACHB-1406 TaxID=2692846 RepID=UPI00168239E4|nr:Spy/CpxP family protein refolding chaperone [Oscillatoria sp. FACHB-1406]MBD2580417.1 Spy/CpxP family protein refolding chaperone [Oscillatoria sp. FACHB-1406]
MKWLALSSLAAVSLLVPAATYAVQSQSNAGELRRESPSVLAQAQPNPQPGNRPDRGQRGRGDGNPMERMLQQLNLSSEQSSQIQAIFQQSRTENESLHEQMKQARDQMESLMAGNATADQLRQQHSIMQRLHQEMGDRRFETMLQVREILTPQQRARMAELKDAKRQERGEPGGMGRDN